MSLWNLRRCDGSLISTDILDEVSGIVTNPSLLSDGYVYRKMERENDDDQL